MSHLKPLLVANAAIWPAIFCIDAFRLRGASSGGSVERCGQGERAVPRLADHLEGIDRMAVELDGQVQVRRGTTPGIAHQPDDLPTRNRVTYFERDRILSQMQVARVEHLPFDDVFDCHYIAERTSGTRFTRLVMNPGFVIHCPYMFPTRIRDGS